MNRSPRGLSLAGVHVATVLVAIVAPRPAAAFDRVIEERGTFAGVDVIGLDDGRLRFRFSDGRTLERPVLDIQQLELAAGADRAASELSRAESLRLRKQPEEAVPLYERVRDNAEHEWARTYAVIRLVQLYDEQGRFDEAAAAYLGLTEKHASLVVPLMPRRLPPRDSDVARRVLERLAEQSKKAGSDATLRAIARLRTAIETGKLPDDDPSVARGRERTPRRTRDAAAKRPPPALPAASRPTAAVYDLLKAGKLDEVRPLIEAGLRKSSEAERDVWLLAEAEYHLVRGEALRAGQSAMKVIALYENSAYHAEAFYLAGRAYESIRVTKAVLLYQSCMKHETATDELKRLAQQRLEELERSAATRPNATP